MLPLINSRARNDLIPPWILPTKSEADPAGDRSPFICPNHQHGAFPDTCKLASDEISVFWCHVLSIQIFIWTRNSFHQDTLRGNASTYGRLKMVLFTTPMGIGHSSRQTRQFNSSSTFLSAARRPPTFSLWVTYIYLVLRIVPWA
jgi:hypothetical protein